MKKIFLLTVILALTAASIFAQTLTQQSYKQAREVLDKSIAATVDWKICVRFKISQ